MSVCTSTYAGHEESPNLSTCRQRDHLQWDSTGNTTAMHMTHTHTHTHTHRQIDRQTHRQIGTYIHTCRDTRAHTRTHTHTHTHADTRAVFADLLDWVEVLVVEVPQEPQHSRSQDLPQQHHKGGKVEDVDHASQPVEEGDGAYRRTDGQTYALNERCK